MSKSKFRISPNDAPDRLPLTVEPTGGALPAHRVPVIDQHGNRRGHVSAKTGSASTALRFGVKNAKLVQRDGGAGWQGEVGPTSGHGAAKLAQQRRQAKGSVTRHPTKPETSAHPKRGH
jgi:hypothetical protein